MVPLLIYYLNMEKITKCRPLGKNSKQSYLLENVASVKNFGALLKTLKLTKF